MILNLPGASVSCWPAAIRSQDLQQAAPKTQALAVANDCVRVSKVQRGERSARWRGGTAAREGRASRWVRPSDSGLCDAREFRTKAATATISTTSFAPMQSFPWRSDRAMVVSFARTKS